MLITAWSLLSWNNEDSNISSESPLQEIPSAPKDTSSSIHKIDNQKISLDNPPQEIPSVPKDTSSSIQRTDNSEIIEELPTYTNSIGMELVKIPIGEFMMGSPSDEEDGYNNAGPVHKVTIEKSFYLGKYEVTQKQWLDVMASYRGSFIGDNFPVSEVTLGNVQEFIKKLNEKEGTDKYRLPSEAEWEYTCRAGTTTRYHFGDNESKLSEYAWYKENSENIHHHPVGQKKPNPWGFYDMYGNVKERVQDRFHGNYTGAPTDGSAWEFTLPTHLTDGTYQSHKGVSRGGSWNDGAGYCRSASRENEGTGNINGGLGFRVLKEL